MKRAELKKVLKPLIKECIKEVIFEEGILSGIITEVMVGLKSSAQPIVERQVVTPRVPDNGVRQELEQVRKQMLEDVNKDAYSGVNIFEGTTPLSEGGTPTGGDHVPNSPLAGTEPGDPGVDISSILSVGRGTNWNKLVNG